MNSQPQCCSFRDCGITVLRITIGAVFVAHGLQKLQHFSDTVNGFVGMGIPKAAAYYAIFAEPIGGVLLVLGLLTRVGAILLAAVMAGAFVKVHGKNGFFLQKGGYEYVLVLFAANVALLLAGSGPLAVDNLLFKRDHPETRGPAQPQPK
jgi:putative oxidoreductase